MYGPVVPIEIVHLGECHAAGGGFSKSKRSRKHNESPFTTGKCIPGSQMFSLNVCLPFLLAAKHPGAMRRVIPRTDQLDGKRTTLAKCMGTCETDGLSKGAPLRFVGSPNLRPLSSLQMDRQIDLDGAQ